MYQLAPAARHLQGRLWMRVPFTQYGVLLLIGVCAAQVCAAQSAPAEKVPETTFRVGTDLVLLNVSVFDAEWKVIKGLPKSAFTVFENGVKQEVTVFRQEDVPVSLGLIIDNSTSMRDKRERVASAALAMVKASNPDDEVFIVNFNEEPTLAQEFTSDIRVLEKSLSGIETRGETAMRDAVLLGIQHLRSRAKRDKRVLVVITDGEDNSSIATQQRLIEAAHQNNAIVYGIGLLGGEQPESAARARKRLEELTNATGGRSWFPTDVGAIAAITPEIAHEIRNQYVVGYTPSDLTKDGKFRTITVEVSVPNATVRKRAGYHARP
jgi:Ca-activated chloride channel homolog